MPGGDLRFNVVFCRCRMYSALPGFECCVNLVRSERRMWQIGSLTSADGLSTDNSIVGVCCPVTHETIDGRRPYTHR